MAVTFNADEHQAVTLPTCATCDFVLGSVPTFLIDGRTYWGVLPHARASYETVCRNLDVSRGKGIYGCAFMREALNPWLRSDPDPPPSADAKPVTITPADDESAWPPARGMREIMARFQSLGDNCEFGLLQRWARVETLDLLRFASFYGQLDNSLRLTINAISDGFSGLGDPASVICELQGNAPPRQYMVKETRWRLLYHTDCDEHEIAPDVLHRQQVRVLQFKRRKLLEDLQEAHRVFVWKSNFPTSEPAVRGLVACLRRHGPNLLLWVVVADQDHSPGLVEYLGDGLLKGYVARFAPYGAADDIDVMPWYAMCRNAAAAAAFLRRCGEWSHPQLGEQRLTGNSAEAPVPEISLRDAAATIHWMERRSNTVVVGPVHTDDTFADLDARRLFNDNPGTRDVRGAELADVTLDSYHSVLLQAGRKIPETRYIIDDNEYARVRIVARGLRCLHADKVVVLGLNRSSKNYYHWMTQSLPTLALSVAQVGADNVVLALPRLTAWHEETLSILGLADLPRIPIHLAHHYHFPKAYFCEFLNGTTSFFLSPRALEVFDRIALGASKASGGPELIYVARSDSANRVLTNEPAVQDVLAAAGFVSVIPGSLSVREQSRLFRDARVVVGAHGAGLTNIGFCQSGTKILELFQSSYLNPCFNRIAQVRQLEYHAASFECTTDPDDPRQAWQIDTDRLATCLATALG
jgi:hypothetical protein